MSTIYAWAHIPRWDAVVDEDDEQVFTSEIPVVIYAELEELPDGGFAMTDAAEHMTVVLN